MEQHIDLEVHLNLQEINANPASFDGIAGSNIAKSCRGMLLIQVNLLMVQESQQIHQIISTLLLTQVQQQQVE